MEFKKNKKGGLNFPNLSKLSNKYLKECSKIFKKAHPDVIYIADLGVVWYGEIEDKGAVHSFDDVDYVYVKDVDMIKIEGREFKDSDELIETHTTYWEKVHEMFDILEPMEVLLKPDYPDETRNEHFYIIYTREDGFIFIEEDKSKDKDPILSALKNAK